MKRRPNPTLVGSLFSMLFLWSMSVVTAGTNTLETPTYSTADGKHRGDITVTPLMSNQVADKMGKFRLSYAVWTLVGEPVQDYLFSWDWPKGEITVGNTMIDGKQVSVTTKDLAKYPDLLGRFVAVKPVGVTLTASIDFYPKAKPGQAAWAGPEWVGRLTIKPDFIQAAGKPGLSFSPGSPDWADFFSLIPASYEPAGKAERARLHKKIWAESREVRLRNLEITKIEWPDGEFTSILRDYARLERPDEKTAQAKAVAPKKAKVNPFDALAENKAATTKPNPFDAENQKVSMDASNAPDPAGQTRKTTSTGSNVLFEENFDGATDGQSLGAAPLNWTIVNGDVRVATATHRGWTGNMLRGSSTIGQWGTAFLPLDNFETKGTVKFSFDSWAFNLQYGATIGLKTNQSLSILWEPWYNRPSGGNLQPVWSFTAGEDRWQSQNFFMREATVKGTIFVNFDRGKTWGQLSDGKNTVTTPEIQIPKNLRLTGIEIYEDGRQAHVGADFDNIRIERVPVQ